MTRCLAIAYVAVQVAIWHSFYLADLWRLAGPVAALAWAAVVVAYLFTRWPQWQFAVVDSIVYVVLALSVGWCVPPDMRGDTANWLYIMMAGQLLVAVWFARLPLSALLAMISGVAYWTGSLLYPEVGPGGGKPASAGAALLAVAVAVWCGRWAMQRWATKADAALARADADSRAQYVELTRNIERREHERLLHDTVLNTLTALARGGGDPRAAVGRCQHDIKLMEYVLNRPAEPGQPAGSPHGGLLAGIEAVAAELRARGLDVHVGVTGAHLAAAGPGAPGLPPGVVMAMTHAVREALSNVAAHAGTGQAWVELRLTGGPGPDADPGAGPRSGGPGPGGVQVTVRDFGRGFDPGRADPARLGLRRSIIDRLADQGSSASIRSAPGQGTEVILRWSGLPQPAAPAPAAGRPWARYAPAAANGSAGSGPARPGGPGAPWPPAEHPASQAHHGGPRAGAAPAGWSGDGWSDDGWSDGQAAARGQEPPW